MQDWGVEELRRRLVWKDEAQVSDWEQGRPCLRGNIEFGGGGNGDSERGEAEDPQPPDWSL